MVYSVLPTLILRPLFFQGLRQPAAKDKSVCLTFDDGPNAAYTPELLDLLRAYHVHATFFVVGERAEKNRALLRRIVREGHLVGIHHYRHVSNWFLSPEKTREQCDRAADTVKRITGSRPVYYRPPWGHLNLFLPQAAHAYRIVLWSAILGDWHKNLGSKRLEQRIIRHLQPGAILCLHDDGENPGADATAPENTIRALRAVLKQCAGQYDFVTIDQLYHSYEYGGLAYKHPSH